MFANCSSLSSLPDISKWNAIDVKDMDEMFKNCFSLLFNYQKNKESLNLFIYSIIIKKKYLIVQIHLKFNLLNNCWFKIFLYYYNY